MANLDTPHWNLDQVILSSGELSNGLVSTSLCLYPELSVSILKSLASPALPLLPSTSTGRILRLHRVWYLDALHGGPKGHGNLDGVLSFHELPSSKKRRYEGCSSSSAMGPCPKRLCWTVVLFSGLGLGFSKRWILSFTWHNRVERP